MPKSRKAHTIPKFDSHSSMPGRMPTDVPGFVVSLWHLVQDPAAQQLICWSDDGKSFLITDGNLLAKEVLPCYFKHSNLSSFVRQLNMYSFRKLVRHDLVTEFAHPCFLRDCPDLLSKVRRVAQNGAGPGGNGRVRSDLASVKAKQSGNEEELTRLRAENQQLWLEVQYLRQQQRRHQDAVRWLLNFFSLLMPKRRAPVQMAIESGQPAAKRQRLATISCDGGTDESGGVGGGGDVTIEEVTEFLMSSNGAGQSSATPASPQQQQQQQQLFNQLQETQSQSQSESPLSSDIDLIVGGSSNSLPSPMHQLMQFDNQPNQQLPPLDSFLDFFDPSAASHDADAQFLSLLADPSEQLHVSLQELVEPPLLPIQPQSSPPFTRSQQLEKPSDHAKDSDTTEKALNPSLTVNVEAPLL